MSVTSIVCPKCFPEENNPNAKGLWEVWNGTAQCTNCGYERPYHRRNAKKDTITPSQQREVEFIKQWFERNRLYGRNDLHCFELTHQKETGFLYVSVETSGHPLTEDGGHFVIGRRGGIRVLSVYGIGDREDTKQHYAKMLGGKVGW